MHERLPEIAEAIPKSLSQNLYRAYSEILCYYAPDPKPWLKETAKLDLKMAESVEVQIHNRLMQADAVQQQDWWSRWLKGYWTDRNLNTPKPLTKDEAKALISWLPHLPAVYEEAAQIAAETEVTEIDPIFLETLSESQSAQEHPAQTGKLLTSLYEKKQPETSLISWLPARSLIERIIDSQETVQTKTLLEEMLNEINHTSIP